MVVAADRLLLRTARQGGGWAVVLVLATLADAAIALLFPAVLAGAIDGVLGGGDVRSLLLRCAALFALSALADVLMELGAGAGAARATAWLRHTVTRHVLAGGARSPFAPGDVTSRVTGGAAEAGNAPVLAIQTGIAVLPPLGAIVALVVIDWRIALVFGLTLPVIMFVLRAYVRDITGSIHRYLTVQGAIAGRLTEALRGSRTIAAAGTTEDETRRVLTDLPRLREHGDEMWRTLGGTAARGVLVGILLHVTVLAIAGFELVAGRISAGELVAATQYAALAVGLGPIVSDLMRLGRARAGAGRMAEVLAVAPQEHGEGTLPTGPGRLEFRGVSAGGALHELDLVVPGGRVVAVVGRSGAGKSLLAALAGRLADPDEGEVLLDGVPLRQLSRAELRRAVGYAFARPALFGGTVRDAIGFGVAAAAEPEAAAVNACADPFIRRLPEGYGTALAEAPMSGGELQRVGLARAFAHPGRLLVLDDATSSLDTATEMQIGQALHDRLGDRTRLIIAHRASTAAKADHVVWLDGGKVRARGGHAELWADPAYRAAFGADIS